MLNVFLVACSSSTSNNSFNSFFANGPISTSIKSVQASLKDVNTQIDETPLSPKYRYLRIWINDQPALIVLGFTETDGTLIWYSSDKNVFKTYKDRYVGSVGFQYNWDNVFYQKVPSWDSILTASKKTSLASSKLAKLDPVPLATISQTRDVVNTYEFKVQDRLAVYPAKKPPPSIPSAASTLLKTKNLVWFKEVIESSSAKNTAYIQGYYGIEEIAPNRARFVFGHLCLQKNDCISWMPWGDK